MIAAARLMTLVLALGTGAWGPWHRHRRTDHDPNGRDGRDGAGDIGVADAGLPREAEERRRVEEVLRDGESQFRALAETSPLAIYVFVGVEQRAIYINPTFTKLFGYTIEDVPTVADWWPRAYPDEAVRNEIVPEWQRRVDRALETGTELEPMEVVVTCRDGSHRDVRWGYKNVGEQSWAYGLDLTELRRSEAELRESEAKYRVVFDKSPDPFLILAHDVFVDCNESAERMLRGDRDRIVGRSPAELSPPLQLDGRTSEDAARSRIAQAVREGDQFFEWVHRRFDGSDVVVGVSMAALTWAGEQAWFIAWRDITERKREQEELHERASTDALTGILNRHRFTETLDDEIRRTRRLDHPLVVTMLDLDDFKDVNDSFGHAAGDQALRHFAHVCRSTIRAVDTFARLGGDEFVLMLPETTGEHAFEILERLRRRFEAEPLVVANREIRLTVSAGIATWSRAQDSPEALLERADRALYEAKQAGRNRVMLAADA